MSRRASFQFGTHHGHLGSIHFDIEHGRTQTQYTGKLQLHSAVYLRLFAVGDIGSDGFRMAFHGFGGYLQACQSRLA